MSLFDLATILMTLLALAGWVNALTFRLPHSVAMLLVGLIGAASLAVLHAVWPEVALYDQIGAVVGRIDFAQTVTGYLLAFLLFAGAMQIDLSAMARRWVSVSSLATLGVFASIFVVGYGLWEIARLLHVPLQLPWALVFGALISPTDPVAVLAAVKRGGFSPNLQTLLEGEALFNDGVGIVAYTALLALALGTGHIDPLTAVADVVVQAVGGLALGMAAGWIVIRIAATLDDFAVEVGMSIALAMGAFAAATALHLSGAIAAVGAGLLFGSRGRAAMSGRTQAYITGFWTLVDEILNALLFFLLGIELLVVPFRVEQIALLCAAIPLVLLARGVVVLPWGLYMRRRYGENGATAVLAWGGLRGALALALALALPPGEERTLILPVTYIVVAFSIVAQGLTFSRLAQWVARRRTARG